MAQHARIAVIIAAALAVIPAVANPGVVPKVYLAGALCQFSPPAQIADGQLLAPLGPVLASHGIRIELSQDGKRLEATSLAGVRVVLSVADGSLKVNDQPMGRATPPRLVDGRWLLPVRPVCEALGFFVHADDSGQRLFVEPKAFVESVEADGEQVKLVLQCAATVEYDCRRLERPERLVLDLKCAALATPAKEQTLSSSLATKVRWSQFAAGEEPVGRIVVELTGRHPYRISRPAPGKIALQIGGGQPAAGQPPAVSAPSAARPTQVIGAGIESDGWSAVILSDGPLQCTFSALREPYRLVIDCANTQLATSQTVVRCPTGIIGRVRMLPVAGAVPAARIVLDLRFAVRYTIERRSEPTALALTFRPGRLGDQLIFVDPGHGGNDPGARYGDVQEKGLNLDMAQRLAGLLRKAGAQVTLTRDRDVAVDLYQRPALANAADATLFLSIHCNAMPQANTGHGTETYYHNDNSALLALVMSEALHSSLQLKDGGPRCRRFVVVRESKMPATLVEVAYLNTDVECSLLTDEQFRQKAAEAMLEGIREYVEGTAAAEEEPKP